MKETENLIFSGVRLIFISLMNTKSGIFTRGEATRENTAFGVHSMLTPKNQISSIFLLVCSFQTYSGLMKRVALNKKA